MGFYIDPPIESKEMFLAKNGRLVPVEDLKLTKTELPVVLVNNFAFTAAGICFSQRELEEFTYINDKRPRKYYMVPRDVLVPYYRDALTDAEKGEF